MIGEQQQAGGVDIEPTDRDPATAADFRQLAEYRAPAFRIITRDEFAGAFLVNQHARRLGLALHRDRPTVDADTVTGIRSEEHTSELQSLMRLSSAVFCL